VRLSYAVVGVPSKDLRGDDLHQQPELMTAQWPEFLFTLKTLSSFVRPGSCRLATDASRQKRMKGRPRGIKQIFDIMLQTLRRCWCPL